MTCLIPKFVSVEEVGRMEEESFLKTIKKSKRVSFWEFLFISTLVYDSQIWDRLKGICISVQKTQIMKI